jgi:hypothetical protein
MTQDTAQMRTVVRTVMKEKLYLVLYNAVQSIQIQSTFRRNI